MKPTSVLNSLNTIKNELSKIYTSGFFTNNNFSKLDLKRIFKKNPRHATDLFSSFFEKFSMATHNKEFKKLEKRNIEIIGLTNQGMLARIKNFKSCKKYGTKNWCITYNEYHWKRYTDTSKGRTQYILWNFDEDHPMNMIAFTCEKIENKTYFVCGFNADNRSTTKAVVTAIMKRAGLSMPENFTLNKK